MRGAEVEHILRFTRDWPDATVVRLEHNYRSTAEIIEHANRLIVFNKTDIAEAAAIERLLTVHPGSVALSAVTGDGVEALMDAITARLEVAKVELSFTVPYERGDVVSALHQVGEVIAEAHTADGTELTVKLEKTEAERFAEFAD